MSTTTTPAPNAVKAQQAGNRADLTARRTEIYNLQISQRAQIAQFVAALHQLDNHLKQLDQQKSGLQRHLNQVESNHQGVYLYQKTLLYQRTQLVSALAALGWHSPAVTQRAEGLQQSQQSAQLADHHPWLKTQQRTQASLREKLPTLKAAALEARGSKV
ncbi:MAG: hypothetical protein RLY92_1169 [Chloroflexota bacterium]